MSRRQDAGCTSVSRLSHEAAKATVVTAWMGLAHSTGSSFRKRSIRTRSHRWPLFLGDTSSRNRSRTWASVLTTIPPRRSWPAQFPGWPPIPWPPASWQRSYSHSRHPC
ncbi:hypothetical protein D3C87_1242720 [compost metagenome]